MPTHLLDVDDLSTEDVHTVLDRAAALKAGEDDADGEEGEEQRRHHEQQVLPERFGRRALHEIAEALAAERGVATCPASVWYFFSRHGLTFKKRRAMPANSNARTSSRSARTGSTANSISTRTS